MPEGHEHWGSLAVDHVLGALDQVSASAFRRHLVGCRQCKEQVAELRDLAGSLEDAARDERAVLALQTRARREVSTDDEVPEAEGLRLPGRVLVAVAVAVVALVGLVGHNIHLQTREAALVETAERQGVVLDGLGSGLVMDTTFSGGASGVVVADGEQVSWSITDLPVPRDDQRLVVWLREPDGDRPVARHAEPAMPDGHVIGSVPDDRARELVVTLEQVEDDAISPMPSGPEFARADLSRVRRGAAVDEEPGGPDTAAEDTQAEGERAEDGGAG